FAAVPVSAGGATPWAWAEPLTGALAETDGAFSGLTKGPFMDETKNTFTAWTRLVDQGPARARDMLLDSLKQGKVKDEYFNVFGGGLKYWDALLVNGLSTLVKETQGDLQTAKSGLVSDAKG